ncbi:hypothetical protein N7474_009004 [Penicillium riverlandense]|uniref:uncharacterized protein n=1 Tax=Penicillium riverlandense TaxID=1903569 RepID=UPI00254954EF|nr:uncharacterized protein N7474_009004 [Penicillium riverlandense]KAJ5807735.1 hypothetical protein N7474_009004 [Penicillium riverlandense]
MRHYLSIAVLLAGSMVLGQPDACPPEPRPKAMVYRGPAACNGCPESVAELLRSSSSHFDVQYAGPNEKIDINEGSLQEVQLYAQPGGGSLKPAWDHTKKYKKAIRDFVARGGRYAGFCVGAYLAGNSPAFGTPGFDILPPSSATGEEIVQPGAQVMNGRNTIIEVNWRFRTGPEKGELQNGRWLFFQDGAVIKLPQNASAIILGRYSTNNDIAASVTPFGNGWVGVVGPHPEADESWC